MFQRSEVTLDPAGHWPVYVAVSLTWEMPAQLPVTQLVSLTRVRDLSLSGNRALPDWLTLGTLDLHPYVKSGPSSSRCWAQTETETNSSRKMAKNCPRQEVNGSAGDGLDLSGDTTLEALRIKIQSQHS